MEFSQLIELLRFPLEGVGIWLLLDVRGRMLRFGARIRVLEKKAGITYPEELQQ